MQWFRALCNFKLHCNCNLLITILDVFICLFFSFWVYTVMFCWTLLLIGTFFKEPLRSCVLECTKSNILDSYLRPVLSSLTREQATSLKNSLKKLEISTLCKPIRQRLKSPPLKDFFYLSMSRYVSRFPSCQEGFVNVQKQLFGDQLRSTWELDWCSIPLSTKWHLQLR